MADSPYIIDVTRDNLAELMEASARLPVLIDFWAGWCQPCLALMPVLAKLADAYGGKFLLGKVNTEEQQELAAEFRIRSLPTVKIFRHGGLVDEFMGALPERAVREFIDRHIVRESDAALDRALAALESGDAASAKTLLTDVRQSDPDNPRVALALAEAEIAIGDLDEAEATLAGLPSGQQAEPEVEKLKSLLFFARAAADAPAAAELETRLASDAADQEARLKLAQQKIVAGDVDRAIELLLELMRVDRDYGEDAGRRSLLKVFELLGDDPRVAGYRRRMANLLH